MITCSFQMQYLITTGDLLDSWDLFHYNIFFHELQGTLIGEHSIVIKEIYYLIQVLKPYL